MTTRKTAGAAKPAPKYEDDALYSVALARPVKLGRMTLTPHNVNRIRGRVLNNDVAEADIVRAEKLS